MKEKLLSFSNWRTYNNNKNLNDLGSGLSRTAAPAFSFFTSFTLVFLLEGSATGRGGKGWQGGGLPAGERESFEVLSFPPSRQMSQRKLSHQGARPESGVSEGKIATVPRRLAVPRAVFSHRPAPGGVRNRILPLLGPISPEQSRHRG